MPITINHDLTATTPDNTSYEIRPSHWNSTHAVTLSIVGSEVVGAFSNANGVSFGTNAQGAITASVINSGGVGIAAGFNSQNTGVVTFQNANNVSFGMDNAGNVTGSVNPPGIVVSAGNAASNISSIVFSNANGVSFGLQGSTLTASYTVPPVGISVAAGGVTNNVSELVLSNSNGLAFGINGSTVTGSYTVPSTAGLLSAIALSAGTASALVSGVTFSNSNNVSFGENNGTVTASATFAQSNQILTLLAGSNTTQGSSGTANASNHIFAGAGNVSVGISNGSVVISGGASGTNPAIGAISAGTQSQTSGTIVFSNSNGVTFGLSAGTITATVNPGPAAGIAAVAANGSTQTTGSVIFSASNGITFGISTGAGAGTVTASYTVPTQTVQTQNLHDVSLGGNTSGTLALVSSGTLILAGGNNITLSQVGNAVTISAANEVPLQTGISGLIVSNATFTSGTVTLQNANGISFGSSGANGISASYTVPSTAGLISAINVSAGAAAQNLTNVVFSNLNGVSFGLNGSVITGSIAAPVQGSVSAGTTNVILGQVIFSNSNSVSFGLNGSTLTASVSAPINLSAGTQAVVGTGFTFSNSNGVTFGMNNGTITASVATNAGGGAGISAIQAGTQIQTSGTILFSNSNNVSFGMNNGTITEAVGLNIFASGNVTQNTSATYNVSALSFSGAGNVSVGNSNGAVVVSAPLGLSAGMSTGGNTLGTTGLASGRLVLAGGANITLSGSTNAGSMTISIVGAAGGTGGASTVGAFAVSNTTLSSQGTLTNSNLSFAGAGIISVGVSNGSVIISAPASTGISQSLFATGNTTQGSSGTQAIGSILFQGAGNVSVGMSNGSVVISGAGGTGGGGGGINFGVSTMGNTFGTTGTVSTGNVVLVGSGVMSLSQSSSGSNATISIFGPPVSSIQGTGQLSVSANGSTISLGVPTLSIFATSNTTQSSSGTATHGSLLFAGAGNVSIGYSNGSVVVSGAGGGNGAAVSIGGNSTSAGAGFSNISSGTAVFFGGNNITLSQNGASITLSGANIGGAQTGISGLVVSNTTYTAGTVTFQNANGISFGSSGAGGISASYTVPTVPSTAAYFFQGNTTGQSSSSTGGDQTLSISLGGLVSGGWSGGSLIFSATQSNQAFSASGGSSAFQTLNFANSNNVTLSNNAGSVVASYALNVSAAGGTSNALSAITFNNANGVSFGLSTGAGVGTITASVNQTNQTLSFAGLSNTVGNTSGVSVDARSISLVGAGAVSVGFSTSAGGTSIVISAAAGGQSNQTLSFAANGNTTGNVSSLTVDARSLTVAGFGGASVGFSTSAGGSTLLVSSPVSSSLSATGAASVSLNGNTWTVGVPAVSMGISGGNTLGNTGTVSNQIVFAGGSNITLSGATNAGGMTVTISGGAGGAGGIAIQASNTTYTSGTVIFSNANGISFGSTAGGITASYTVPTQSVQTVGLYGSSQTTNSSSGTVDARSISFVGQGNISVGFSNGSFLFNDGGAGASTEGNFITGNTTNNTSGTFALSSQLFNAQGAITMGITNGSLQISAPVTSSLSATGLVSIVTQISTISIGVNAAGTSYSTASTVGAFDTGAINTNGITVSMPYMTRYIWPAPNQLTAVTAPSNANMSIQYVPVYMPVTGTRIDALAAFSAGSSATTNTGGFAFSQYAIIYTLNGATLSSLSSGSTQTTYTYASNTAGHTELSANVIRPISVPINFNMAPGEYYVGFNFVTATTSIGASTTNAGLTVSMYGGNDLQTALNYAEFGSNTATSTGLFRLGVYSAATTGVVTRVSLSAINQTGSAQSAGNIALVFRNG